jgi:penicillin-binding protein 1A
MKHAFGGKTGTTNNFTDAWFIGFSPSITCGTWIGFDDPSHSLGEKETGAKAALPMWMEFMKVAVADRPNEQFARANEPKKKLDVDVTPAAEPSGAAGASNSSKADDDHQAEPASEPRSAAPSSSTAPVPPPANEAMPEDGAGQRPAVIIRRPPPAAPPRQTPPVSAPPQMR